jgi:hypothetical protein
MDQLPRVKPGQLLGLKDAQGRIVINQSTANFLNRVVAEIKRLGRVSAQAPLRWSEDDDGRRFECDLPPFIWAKLSGPGTGGAYDFVQQQYNPATNAWSDMTGGRTGTSNAYESKGKSGLAGKVVRLEYVPTANDWRFQMVCASCGCAHLGPCADPIPETLSFQDTFYGVTMAAIWTPTNPANPCVGFWIAYNLLNYPGSTSCITGPCPSSTVAMRYKLSFNTTAPFDPVMTVDFHGDSGCPTGGTVPDGPWNVSLAGDWGLVSKTCTPKFAATFGLTVGTPMYDCHGTPDAQIIVTTP